MSIGSGGATSPDGSQASARGSLKVDADELLLLWMKNWDGWVDEVFRKGYQPEIT